MRVSDLWMRWWTMPAVARPAVKRSALRGRPGRERSGHNFAIAAERALRPAIDDELYGSRVAGPDGNGAFGTQRDADTSLELALDGALAVNQHTHPHAPERGELRLDAAGHYTAR